MLSMHEKLFELFCIKKCHKFFFSHITVIQKNDRFLYYGTNQIYFHKILFWHQSKSNSKKMFDCHFFVILGCTSSWYMIQQFTIQLYSVHA